MLTEIFGVDTSSSVHFNKEKVILIHGECSTEWLNDTTYTAEKKYLLNFTKHNKFCLSLHYNGANSYLFFNSVEIIKLKAKDSEIKPTPYV